MMSDMELLNVPVVFQSRNDGIKAGGELEINQCANFLNGITGDGYRSYVNGNLQLNDHRG